MEGKLEFGNYWEHIESWYPTIAKENVLFLTYEDMKEDILRELSRIGTFIGGEWGEKLKGDNARQVSAAESPQRSFPSLSLFRFISISSPEASFLSLGVTNREFGIQSESGLWYQKLLQAFAQPTGRRTVFIQENEGSIR